MWAHPAKLTCFGKFWAAPVWWLGCSPKSPTWKKRGREGGEKMEGEIRRKDKKGEKERENGWSCEKGVQMTQIRGGKRKWEEIYSGKNYRDRKRRTWVSQRWEKKKVWVEEIEKGADRRQQCLWWFAQCQDTSDKNKYVFLISEYIDSTLTVWPIIF